MIILLYGPNSYSRQKKLHEILAQFEKKNGNLGQERFDMLDKDSAAELMDFCRSRTLFSPKRLAVATNVFAADDKQLKTFLKSEIAKDEDAVIVLNEPSKPPAPYKFLIDEAQSSQEFGEPDDKELDAFIKKESKERGADLDKDSAAELKAKWDGDLWGIATDIEVLALGGKGMEINKMPEFFALVNGIQYGNDLKRKILSLEYLVDGRKDDPAYVFNSLSYGAKGAVLKKMAAYDLSVKSGGMEYEEALLDLLL